jgi:tetratricopeptide (TPR) repeat protein
VAVDPRIWTFLYRQGHRDDEIATCEAGVAATAHLHDLPAQSTAHRLLGCALSRAGRHEEAIGHLGRAVDLAERTGDLYHQAYAHQGLACAWEDDENIHQAMAHATRSLNLYQTIGNPVWEANVLTQQGWYAALLGDYSKARSNCETALTVHRRHDNGDGMADALDNLGYVAQHTGHYAQAVRY